MQQTRKSQKNYHQMPTVVRREDLIKVYASRKSYDSQLRCSAWHFCCFETLKDRFADLKWTTVNDRKEAIIRATKKSDCSGGQLKPIEALEGKKRGRPSLLAEDLTEDIKSYIYALREAGGVVNTSIVLAAATAMLQKKDPFSLHEKKSGEVFVKENEFCKTKSNNKGNC